MRILLIVASTFLAFTLTACASNPPGAGQFDRNSLSSERNLSQYESVYVAKVEISTNLQKSVNYDSHKLSDRKRPISEKDLNRKANDLRQELITSISAIKPIASAPGDGVLTITPILTDLAASRPTSADLADKPSLSINSQYTGKAAATFTFSEGDREFGSVSDSYQGYFQDAQFNSTWTDVDRAFSRWARNIAAMLH